MKRITVDQFEGFNLMDVYMIDTNSGEGVQELKQGLTVEEASDYIDNLITKHDMNETDLIRNNWFDQDEYLVDVEKVTVKEYLAMKK